MLFVELYGHIIDARAVEFMYLICKLALWQWDYIELDFMKSIFVFIFSKIKPTIFGFHKSSHLSKILSYLKQKLLQCVEELSFFRLDSLSTDYISIYTQCVIFNFYLSLLLILHHSEVQTVKTFIFSCRLRPDFW